MWYVLRVLPVVFTSSVIMSALPSVQRDDMMEMLHLFQVDRLLSFVLTAVSTGVAVPMAHAFAWTPTDTPKGTGGCKCCLVVSIPCSNGEKGLGCCLVFSRPLFCLRERLYTRVCPQQGGVHILEVMTVQPLPPCSSRHACFGALSQHHGSPSHETLNKTRSQRLQSLA